MVGSDPTNEEDTMNTRTLIAALAATCLSMLQACDMSSTTRDTTASASEKPHGAVALRIATKHFNVLKTEGTDIEVLVHHSDWSFVTDTIMPLDSGDIVIPRVPVDSNFVEVRIRDAQGYAVWEGIDTVVVLRSSKYTYAEITLFRTPAPTGLLALDLKLAEEPEDSVASWNCQNPGPDGYCLDSDLLYSSSIGPWNCSRWDMVQGKRHCLDYLPIVTPPAEDTFCSAATMGTPKVCHKRKWNSATSK